jgi:signal peptidase I
MAAGESREFVFEVMPDEENVAATLLLEGDEIVFDNRRYVSVRLPSARSILLIRDEQSSNASLRSYLMPLLEAAAETDTKIEVEQRLISNTDFSDLPEYDAIVLDGLRRIPEFAVPEILNFVQQGGGLLFIPAADGDMTGYNRFLGNLNMGRFADVRGSYGSFQAVDRLGTIREGHPVINDLFDLESDDQIRINTPELFYYYRFDAGGNPRIFTILQTQAGHPVLTEQEVGNGNVMVLSLGTDPGWSNFPVKPIFAPIFYRTVLYLASGDQGGIQEHILGESFTTTIDGNPEQIALTLNDERVIPERRQTHSGLQIDYDGIEWQPGFLTIEADDKQYTFAVNLNAMESNPVTLSETELKAVLEVHTEGVRVNRVQGSETEMENVIQSASFGKEIWYWFIIAAFVLLVTESIISRMYKAESIQ